MQSIAIKTAQMFLSLFIITFVHEIGHYLWARLFRIRVARFQIFGFSILEWQSRRLDTKIGIGWLPLGGYCLMPEMSSCESSFKKLLVYLGGVMNNLLLAFFIFQCIAWFYSPTSAKMIDGTHLFKEGIQNYGQALATANPSDNGGFISLGSIFQDSWNSFRFWFITAYFSIAMAFINLAPIPGLDGGQIITTVIETVIRRPINEYVKICANVIGLSIVLILILYGNYNDIVRLLNG